MGFIINWYIKFQNWPPQSSRRTLFWEDFHFEEDPKHLFYHLKNMCDGVPLEFWLANLPLCGEWSDCWGDLHLTLWFGSWLIDWSGADMQNVQCKPCAARVNCLGSGKFWPENKRCFFANGVNSLWCKVTWGWVGQNYPAWVKLPWLGKVTLPG